MIKTDCVHFNLDRPCRFHKEKGIKCSGCGKYEPASGLVDGKTKILIIKLGAMGDVLRTTFILEGLKEKYPRSHITWIVESPSIPILADIPSVDRIIRNGPDVILLAKERFAVSINLDLSPVSLGIATMALADRKIGFYLDKKRRIVCSNNYAKKWLLMSAFDDVKKANKKTYQWWMSKIVRLRRADYEICVSLAKDSVKKANEFAVGKKLKSGKVVGINPGAGGRWKLKKWTTRGYEYLIEKLNDEGATVVLYGGPDEKGLITRLIKSSKGNAVSAGTDNSIPDFFAKLNLCDVVVCGDTLAMHAALGLKKNVVAIFGPTSADEIEMYGRGTKVVSPIKCQCCYRPRCDMKPNCMDLIKPEVVYDAVRKYL